MALLLITGNKFMSSKILENIKNYYPEYELFLPLSKCKINFKPFRVKDAKNIAIILQEDNKKLALNALYEVIKNNTKGINVDDICLAEAEYIFLHIRSKSIDETINVIYDKEKYVLNISDVSFKNTLKTEVVKINDHIIVELNFPTLKELLELEIFDSEHIQKATIKKVILNNEIYETKKYVSNEIKELLDNLPISFLKHLDAYISAQPKLHYKIVLKDGNEKEVSGLLDFFIFR